MSLELHLPESEILAMKRVSSFLTVSWVLTLLLWSAAGVADLIVNGSFATLRDVAFGFFIFIWGAIAFYTYTIPILWREHHERNTN